MRPRESQEEGISTGGALIKKRKKILTGTTMETKRGAETEGKATQRLSYLGIHPINSNQTPKLLWMTRSAYQKECVIVIF